VVLEVKKKNRAFGSRGLGSQVINDS